MFTPGAAMSTSAPKLLKLARESSGPSFVASPAPPGRPSESAKAETVITSSKAAGRKVAASLLLLPAATTTVTPAATTRQTASCSGSLPVHVLSDPGPPRLMLTTSIVSLLVTTQSNPQMTSDVQALPSVRITLTAQRRAPGATPTTPTLLSKAPMMP